MQPNESPLLAQSGPIASDRWRPIADINSRPVSLEKKALLRLRTDLPSGDDGLFEPNTLVAD